MKLLYLITTVFLFFSCKNTQQMVIIKGNYTYDIISVPNRYNEIPPRLKGKILEKDTSEPLENSALMITLSDGKIIGTEPDKNGYFELDIPVGEFQVEVISSEKTRIKTKIIKFEANKEYDFTFNMGTTIQDRKSV